MDPNAVLGLVDPQLGQSPAASVLKVLNQKKPGDNEIVAAIDGASNRLINIEDLTEEEVRTLRKY